DSPRSQAVTVCAGATITRNCALAPNPGTISGTVTDAGSSQPVQGAVVTYSGGSATTNQSGQYTLANAAEGSYTVTASAMNYVNQGQSVTVLPGASVIKTFALSLVPGTITGRVTSAPTGQPVAGAAVSYSGGSTITNSARPFSLANVPPGTYSL